MMVKEARLRGVPQVRCSEGLHGVGTALTAEQLDTSEPSNLLHQPDRTGSAAAPCTTLTHTEI